MVLGLLFFFEFNEVIKYDWELSNPINSEGFYDRFDHLISIVFDHPIIFKKWGFCSLYL